MKNLLRLATFACIFTFLLFSVKTTAQTPGIIVRPAGGNGVTALNPDGNGWSSATAGGFTTSDVAQSEIPFKAVPATFIETTGDLTRGPLGGFSEIVVDANGSGFYSYYDGTNLFFRIRIGGLVKGSKGYSVLIDSDSKFGNAGTNPDPNFVAGINGKNGNPGFEWEVVLESKSRVAIYSIDGTISPVFVASFPLNTNHQISVASTTNSGNADYLYDFFVPVSAFTGYAHPITASTPLRMVATTVMAGGSAINGPKSDINGIGAYLDAGTAWTKIVTNTPSFTPADIGSGGTGIPGVLTAAPVLTTPINIGGSVNISGTWTRLSADKGSSAKIRLYRNNILIDSVNVNTGSGWSINSIVVSQNDEFFATAQATDETESPASNSFDVIACTIANTSTTTGLTFSCTSERGMEGTRPANASVKLYSIEAGGGPVLFANDATGTYLITYPDATSWRYDGSNSNGGSSACSGGPTDIPAGQYRITATESGKCESNFIFDINSCSLGSSTSTPTITQTNLFEGSSDISGTAEDASTVRLYRNGTFRRTQTLGTGVTAYSFTGVSLNNDDVIEIYAQASGKCVSLSASKTVGAVTSVPFINTVNDLLVAGATTISGTSEEPEGTLVTIYENGISMGTATVQANGTWSFTITVTLGNTYYATQTRSGASVSEATPTYSVATATTQVPVITGSYTSSSSPVSGTIASGFIGKIFLYLDGEKADSVSVSSGTTWSIPVNTNDNNELNAGTSITTSAQETGSAENETRSNEVIVSCDLPTTPVISPVSASIYTGKTITYTVTNAQAEMLFSLSTDAGLNVGVSAFGTGSDLNIVSNIFNTANSYNLRIKSTSFSDPGCESFATATLTVMAVPTKIYVNPALVSSGNGETWATGFKELSDALQFATNNAGVSEVWVKAGTYKPIYDASGNASPADDRTKTFSIPTGLTVYGGFAGTENLLSERNITTNLTTLSGDLGTTTVTTDNAYHVVTVSAPTSATALNGVTVTAGNANGSGNDGKGGGIYTTNGAANFSMDNVIVLANLGTSGAGMYSDGSGTDNFSNPTISNSIFKNNTATGSGGAVYTDGSSSGTSSPTFTKTVFENNTGADGGAIYRTGTGTSTYTNSIFVNNNATATGNQGGGAMYVNGGTVNIVNSTFNDNATASSVNASANTFAIASGSTVNALNTIVWGSAATQVYNAGSINYTNSLVKGEGLTAPNSSANPMFKNTSDLDGPDNIWGTADDGLFVRCGSPASVTGSATGAPATDMVGTTRPAPPSMGAYESDNSTSSAWTGTVSSDWNTPGNWCSGIVPTGLQNISIFSGAPNSPVIAAGAVSINSLYIESGSTLTVNGILQIEGSIITNGGLQASAGTIELSGRNPQVIPANTFVSNTVKNLITNNIEGVSNAGTLNITGMLTPAIGSFATGGFVTLKSTSIANTAIIGQVGGSVIGDLTIERFIPVGKRAYRQLSSGVNSTDNIRANWQENGNNVPGLGIHITGSKTGANGFDATWSGEYNMYTYTAGAPNYTAITQTNGTNKLKALQGYRVFFNGDRFADLTILQNTGTGTANHLMNNSITLRATGEILSGTVTYTGTGATANGVTDNTIHLGATTNQYALIANPYWSPVNFDLVGRTNLDATYYIWDPSLGNRGGYVSYTVGSGSNNAFSLMDNNIQPGQAIFIKTIGANPTLQFQEAHKSNGLTAVFRTPSQTPSKLRIYLYENNSLAINGTMQDAATVAFRDDFNAAVGQEDATKFTNTDENLAIVRSPSVLGLEGRPTVTAADTIPLRLWKLYSNNQYTLKITGQDFDAGIEASLHDKLTNIQYPIDMMGSMTLPFAFTLADSASYYNRFQILLRPSQTLPVNFTSVKANKKGNQVQVDWKVAAESNIEAYRVERSKDGRGFEEIGNVSAKGNNNSAVDYTWIDKEPNSGANYYRIASVEKSGEKKYSTVVKVNMADDVKTVSIYPNPAVAGNVQVTVKEMPADNYNLKLYNTKGELIFNNAYKHVGGIFNQKLMVENSWPAGMYSIVITNGSSAFTGVLQKQ